MSGTQGEDEKAVKKYAKCCKYIAMLRDCAGSTEDEEEKRNSQTQTQTLPAVQRSILMSTVHCVYRMAF